MRRAQSLEPIRWRLATVAILAIAAILIFSPYLGYGFLGRRFVSDTKVTEGIGLAMIVAGMAFSIWARRHLGQFWSARVTLKVDHELIQSGPYARVRHPIYSGLLLAMLGTALFIGEWRALLGVAIFFSGPLAEGSSGRGVALASVRTHIRAILAAAPDL